MTRTFWIVVVGLGVLVQVRPAVAAGPQASTSPVTTQSQQHREVLLATRRDRRLHVFDPTTLQPLGYFAVGELAHSVSSSPDGNTLYIAQAMDEADGAGCCTLFAIDLTSNAMSPLLELADSGVSSLDGRWLFTQRGNVGIDVFDARTLTRRPTIAAPGVYAMYPSPDSRWLFGTTIWAGPSLDIIDIENMSLIRRLPLPSQLYPRGAWVGDRFYLYAHDGTRGQLWSATPEAETLGTPRPVDMPDLASGGEPVLHMVIAAGQHLALYEPFGTKLDRRRNGKNRRAIPGGVLLVEPGTGKLLRRLAPAAYFNQVVASSDGRYLYGIEPGGPEWGGPVRLLKIDTHDGKTVGERVLDTDVWSLARAAVPERLIPNGEVRPKASRAFSRPELPRARFARVAAPK